MPDIKIDNENRIITIDFSEVEYKALSWIDREPLSGIVQRINGKVEHAISEAVKWELNHKFNDPESLTMPASKEELIMQSTRPSLLEQELAIDDTSSTPIGNRVYE